MKGGEVMRMLDTILTRRKDRLRILYAAFLALQAGVLRPAASQLRKRVGLDDEAFNDALRHLERGGYVTAAADNRPADDPLVVITHAGIVAMEHALIKLDRAHGEFPDLKSILGADLSLPTRP